MPFNGIAGKHALVVGSARGIGAATVRLLAAQGAIVTFSYLQNTAAAQALVHEVRRAGGNVDYYQADAHDAEQVKTLVECAYEPEQRLDIVVNCVPPKGEFKPFAYLTWEEFIRGVESELKADFELAQAVLPLMKAQHAGNLVFVSSAWDKYPSQEGLTSFSAAFAALGGFVRALAKEVGPYGITVNTVAPGLVETDLSQTVPAEVREQVAANTPLNRIATPEDIAGVIAFLASDASRFMTGTYLPVSGGLAMA
jgi:3-oxoacyl-[acyl-carrier protein] reductase